MKGRRLLRASSFETSDTSVTVDSLADSASTNKPSPSSTKRRKRRKRGKRSRSLSNAAAAKKRLSRNPLARSQRSSSMSKKAAKSDNDEEDYGSFDDENDGEGKVVEEKESVQANAVDNESASLQGRQLSAEEEEAAERKRMQEAMRRVQRAETKLRELSFREEESRVREGVDGFVPHPVTELTPAIKELDDERERLARVEAAAANRDLERKTNSEKRDIRVEQMAAAESIQRIVRGRQGRIRFRVIKKQKELDESGVSRLPPLHPALGSTAELLAHDVPESGGDQVGEDDGMGDMDEHEYLNGSRKAKLPFLRQRTFERERPLSATSSVSSTASSDLDVDDNIPAEKTPRLFLPDGSPDVKLRDTVRNALKVSRFDSVSTLLASGPMARKVRRAARRPTSQEVVRTAHVAFTPDAAASGMSSNMGGNFGKFVSVVKTPKSPAGKGLRKGRRRRRAPRQSLRAEMVRRQCMMLATLDLRQKR